MMVINFHQHKSIVKLDCYSSSNILSSKLSTKCVHRFGFVFFSRYVSTIKSSERFIDRIIDRQREFSDQIKILQFLNNCFRLTDTFIRREMIQPRFFASLFTFDELERAHQQINELLRVIDIRLNTVKTWIPPTIPFLNV